MFSSKLIKNSVVVMFFVILTMGIYAAEVKKADTATKDLPKPWFKFGVISDIHFGRAPDNTPKTATDNFNAAMTACVNKRCDFVIVTGDIIESSGSDSQFNTFDSAVTAFGKPLDFYYPVSGNHDISDPPTMTNINKWITRGYGRGTSNREYYGFVYINAAIFVLDTLCIRGTGDVLQRFTDEISEMEAFFSANASIPIKIVVGHIPLFENNRNEPNNYNGRTYTQNFAIDTPYRTTLMNSMDNYDVKYYIAGHRHFDNTVTDSTTNPSHPITVLTNTTLNFKLGTQPGSYLGYSTFIVTDTELTKTFYKLLKGDGTYATPTPSPTPTPTPTPTSVKEFALYNKE